MTSRRFGVSSVTGVSSIMAVSRVAALCGSAGIALFALSGAALAEDKFAWSASLTGTSDYVFRGFTQTDGDPTIQGSLGVSYGMFYAGGWASGLDFGDGPAPSIGEDAQIEIDWYGGIKPTWGPATFDFGVIYYTYPGATDYAAELDYLEWKAGVSGEIYKGLTAGATVYYSDDYTGETGTSWFYEGTLAYTLPKVAMFTPTVSGLIGHGTIEQLTDYTYWNAGVALGVDNLTFDFRYWDTDLSGCNVSPFACATRASCSAPPWRCPKLFAFAQTILDRGRAIGPDLRSARAGWPQDALLQGDMVGTEMRLHAILA